MMHNAFSLQNQSYFPSTQGTALCFINCFTLPQISVVTWQRRQNHVRNVVSFLPFARPATRALTHRHAHTIRSDKETNAFWNLIRVGDSCHFLSVSPGKFSTRSRAWKVFRAAGRCCLCVRIGKVTGKCNCLRNSWDRSHAVCHPAWLPDEAPVRARLVCYDTNLYFWTAFSPLCNHSMLLIWFLITIYGRCCSVALTRGRWETPGSAFFFFFLF